MPTYRKSNFYSKTVGASSLHPGTRVHFKFLKVLRLFILPVLWFTSSSTFILWYKIHNIRSYNFMKEHHILSIAKNEKNLYALENSSNVCVNWVKIFHVFIFDPCACILTLVNLSNSRASVNWRRAGSRGNMIGISVWCDFKGFIGNGTNSA